MFMFTAALTAVDFFYDLVLFMNSQLIQ